MVGGPEGRQSEVLGELRELRVSQQRGVAQQLVDHVPGGVGEVVDGVGEKLGGGEWESDCGGTLWDWEGGCVGWGAMKWELGNSVENNGGRERKRLCQSSGGSNE